MPVKLHAAAMRASSRVLIAVGLMTVLAAAAPVPSATSNVVDTWQTHVADAATTPLITLPNGNKIFSAAVLTPRPMKDSGLGDSRILSSLTPSFWQNSALIAALMFGLVVLTSGARFGIAAWNRRLAGLDFVEIGDRRVIAISDEGPARICRNPVPSLDALTTIDAWPSMAPASTWQGADASRRASTVDGAIVGQSSAVLASYRFYALNDWGVVDSGTGGRFESDEAAIGHAHRIADDNRVEVWRNGRKLMTVDGGRGFVEAGRPSYA